MAQENHTGKSHKSDLNRLLDFYLTCVNGFRNFDKAIKSLTTILLLLEISHEILITNY